MNLEKRIFVQKLGNTPYISLCWLIIGKKYLLLCKERQLLLFSLQHSKADVPPAPDVGVSPTSTVINKSLQIRSSVKLRF